MSLFRVRRRPGSKDRSISIFGHIVCFDSFIDSALIQWLHDKDRTVFGKREHMTDRELKKLRRSDLLEMLIEQKKITAAAEKAAAKEKAAREDALKELAELDATYQRLRKKLDDKDQKIHELRAALEEVAGNSDAESLASMSARLNRAVELFEKTAEEMRSRVQGSEDA